MKNQHITAMAAAAQMIAIATTTLAAFIF